MTQPLHYMWKCQPEAEALVQSILDSAVSSNTDIAQLQEDLIKYTSSRLFDWIDHVVVESSVLIEKQLESAGFIPELVMSSYRVFHHPGAQLPRVVVKDPGLPLKGIAVSVESISDYFMVRGRSTEIEGTSFSGYRRALVSIENNVGLWVVERRGSLTMEPTEVGDNHVNAYIEASEKWQMRPRDLQDETVSLERAIAIAEDIIQSLGVDLAAWVVLEVERKYWQARNVAGQLQKNRQDRMGMGWANHDHHTFRSSRQHFHVIVRLFEMLGFSCRERYYTGAEAGWGAQIMENSRAKLVLFLDVDLAPEEIEVDFAHHPLRERSQLGTIGLWCGLHGDSILRGGMHHLEAQFLFDELTEDLQKMGVGMMAPFSHFPYLKQAFTQGEIWRVAPLKVQRLLEEAKISAEQAQKFLAQGAIGSHMENLQRREGYKGFNQKNVSLIIKETDPRRVLKDS